MLRPGRRPGKGRGPAVPSGDSSGDSRSGGEIGRRHQRRSSSDDRKPAAPRDSDDDRKPHAPTIDDASDDSSDGCADRAKIKEMFRRRRLSECELPNFIAGNNRKPR